jgi:hypothetical protein
MPVSYPVRLIAVLGTALLGTHLLRPTPRGSLVSGGPSPNPVIRAVRPLPRSTFERALREALRLRTRAELTVNEEREVIERLGASTEEDRFPEACRRTLMARDAVGDLARARAAARRAETLARTAEEQYRVALLRVRFECDAGYHAEELRQARRVMALRPLNPTSLLVLQHAAACSGEWRLQRWAREHREALETRNMSSP